MSYTKNTWIDQDVERPKTYEVTNNQDGSITLTDSFGLVTELGTPVNAVNMNHIEDGIDGCAIRKHNLTETFNLGEWVLGGSGDDEGIYKSLIANNVGNALTDSNSWEKVKMGGSSRNVGEIITSTLPLTDAGLHLLDGTRLSGDGIYKGFVDYIAELYTENPDANYFTTETDWQASVTQYGSCGKFVYDSELNTVRLPKVSDILQGTTNISALGDLVEESLPNITGEVGALLGSNLSGVGLKTGVFKNTSYGGTQNLKGTASALAYNDVSFNASNSSSVYKDNAPVQPQTIKALLYIVVATSTKTDIQVDIDNIATDLNGKADVDLTNTTDQAKILMGSMAMPSDKYIDLTLGASGSTYTAPANGYYRCYIGGSSGYKWLRLHTTSDYIQEAGFSTNSNICFTVPIQKGQTLNVQYSGTLTVSGLRFIYAQGSESEV